MSTELPSPSLTLEMSAERVHEHMRFRVRNHMSSTHDVHEPETLKAKLIKLGADQVASEVLADPRSKDELPPHVLDRLYLISIVEGLIENPKLTRE